mgnify:CR=1 FL=1
MRLLRKTFLGIGVSVVSIGPASHCDAAGENLLTNPGFEQASEKRAGMPSEWGFTPPAEHPVYSTGGDRACNGSAATGFAPATHGARLLGINSNHLPLKPGHKYRFTAFVHTSGLDEDDYVILQMIGKDEDGAPPDVQKSNGRRGDTDGYRIMSMTVAPTPDHEVYVPGIKFNAGTNRKTGAEAAVYIDDLAVVNVVAATASETGAASRRDRMRGPDAWYSVYQFYESTRGKTYDGKGYWWANNDYGYADRVPAPWEPVARERFTLRARGRTYDLADRLLPRQISVHGRPLLVKPMQLILELESGRFPTGDVRQQVLHERDTTVKVLSSKRAGDVELTVDTELSYDGLMRFDLSIDAPEGTRIRQLTLNLPFRPDIARRYVRFMDYDYDQKRADRFATLTSMGDIMEYERFDFRPTVWIGNDERGLEWVCESNIDFFNGKPDETMAFLDNGREMTFRVQLIDRPVTLGGELRYSFGVLPTPSKPPGGNRWTFLYTEGLRGPERFADLVEKHPGVELWSRMLFARAPLEYAGLPLPPPTGEGLEKYRETRRQFQRYNANCFPYGAMTHVLLQHPAAQDFSNEWRLAEPSGGGNWAKHAGFSDSGPDKLPLDPAVKSVQDFLVAQQVRAIRNYGHNGLYYDLHTLKANGARKRYGDRPVDLAGKLFLPIYGKRETMQRLWVATKSLDPDFRLMCHLGIIGAVSTTYIDAVLAGEVFNTLFRNDPIARRMRGEFVEEVNYGNLFVRRESSWGNVLRQWRKPAEWYAPNYYDIPDDVFRTYVNQNRGYQFYLLPQIVKWTNNYMDAHPELAIALTREMLARTLVWNVPLWAKRAHMPTVEKTYQILYEFGVHKAETRHLACTEAAKQIAVESRTDGEVPLRRAAWAAGKQLLIVLSNPNAAPATARFTPPLEWSGGHADGTISAAADPETGDPLSVDSCGRITVERIGGHDFRLVELSLP